ncbi:hypothetical protein [Noviherbaspirillum sp. UKPF54]|uniref:hypothetical protein n=1 Tax=Noviherbaspirillum sp. UKPF54 TaxID=2601898 RepID=UPI0011B17341|nr:hypothetical protein [Noviherbaspirillum sp. UKPF54]QDZ28705.1 hypothetical protein FAY22_12535 [Noviherbaspirillum sp. UKPF54]
MLTVSIHSGSLDEQCHANQLAKLDIAYAKKAALADYVVALSLRNHGELAPAELLGYPRWSSSLWELVARALGKALYRDNEIPHSSKPDRRCAYATRLCASIERMTSVDRGVELGTVEILQKGAKRGLYTAEFTEDILGSRTVKFEYGCKALNPCELLLRAICWAWYGTDILGPMPALIVPAPIRLEGVDRFHLESLSEPARTGFKRFLADGELKDPEAARGLPRADSYVHFLYS